MPGESARVSRLRRGIMLALVVFPFLGVLTSIVLAWGHGFGWPELVALSVMYVGTGLGITVGFHRLFSHHAFEAVWPLRLAVAGLGSMAAQGPVLIWTALHRRHHQHSDESEDPHSPHAYGTGVLAMIAGMWHAHLGWMFQSHPSDLDRYVPDLRRDGLLRFMDATFIWWVIAGLLLPAAFCGLVTGTWLGALSGLVWGGLVRLFLVHHLTWSINSVCHVWGQRPFRNRDESRNNVVFGVLAFGEGWHNNHHAFPASARHGLAWWQLDITYLIIRACEALGLIWRVRSPSRGAILARLGRSATGAGQLSAAEPG